jgi:hypothetical protein
VVEKFILKLFTSFFELLTYNSSEPLTRRSGERKTAFDTKTFLDTSRIAKEYQPVPATMNIPFFYYSGVR